MRSVPLIGRPAALSPRTVAAPRRRKKATARSTRPMTSSPMATPGCERRLREEVGSRSWTFREWRLLFAARPNVAELLAAGDTFFSDEAFEHQLTRRHDRRRILLGRQPHLIDEIEQTGDDGEAFQQRLGALVRRDLERTAFIEPVHDVVHVGAAHPALERPAGRAADQILGNRLRALQLPLVLELELAGDGR